MAHPVVVLGGGSTGEAFAAALRRLDASVPITVVERRLLGGECSYYACMPTKALLRPPEALAAARRAPGAGALLAGGIEAERVFWHRDEVVGRWDDSSQEAYLAERGIRLVRAEGRVEAPGLVVAGGEELPYAALAIATGSEPEVPRIPGLANVPFWTNRDAAALREVPPSVIVLGAGPVGVEFGQLLSRLGSTVSIVDVADRLLPREDPEAGALLRQAFEEEGIAVRTSARVERVASADGGIEVSLAGGARLQAARLLVATGRRPSTEGFGFERLSIAVSPRAIEVDERMRATDGVYAIGDVNGIAPFTHAGKYQARIAAADCAGAAVRADHRAVPAVTFTDPQVASVGRTGGEELATAIWRLDATARAATYERPRRPGLLKVFADPERRVLVGAVAVGPEAGEWLGQLTLAVRAQVPLEVLRDTIQPYPTFSEAVFFAVRELPL